METVENLHYLLTSVYVNVCNNIYSDTKKLQLSETTEYIKKL